MNRNVLITGVNGQDGYFLSRLLVSEGYEVFGIGNQKHPSPLLGPEIKYISCDLRDTAKLLDICSSNKILGIYNLAGISSVARSFMEPELTKEINFSAPLRLLDQFFKQGPEDKKFFQASSSEMFGTTREEPQSELTPLNPISPYAKWKAEFHLQCQVRRELGYFVSSAIMYNHESFLRPETFVSKKVVRAVAEIFRNKRDSLTLGNLGAERDWGFAGDFMEAVAKVMKLAYPDEFVIATGKFHSVLDMAQVAFSKVGLSGKEFDFIKIEESLMRPFDVKRLVGDSTKALQVLGWTPKTSFEDMISEMLTFELTLI